MATRIKDLHENTSASSSYSQNKDGVCSNCGCADNSDRSSHSSNSSRNSVREANSHSRNPVYSGDGSNSALASGRSESCTDLNDNSRIDNNNIPTSRRSPSIASLSKNVSAVRPFSVSLDAGSGNHRNNERFHSPKECVKDSSVLYLTPLQRKERELKEMKKEIARLYNELSQKDERIFQLQLQLEEQAKDYQDELDRKIAEIQDLMEEKDRVTEVARQENISKEEELAKMDQMFTELKVKQKLQEDQFQDRYLDMYKRGQKAAMFEREQELEMIATSKQPKVTVRELTRKLSMTESELAKWQSLRLDETYKSADKPLTDADVTLSFLRDSFFHFICNRDDCLRHFRAIVEIFRYSDTQMCKIRKTVSESKDFNRLFKKETG